MIAGDKFLYTDNKIVLYRIDCKVAGPVHPAGGPWENLSSPNSRCPFHSCHVTAIVPGQTGGSLVTGKHAHPHSRNVSLYFCNIKKLVAYVEQEEEEIKM